MDAVFRKFKDKYGDDMTDDQFDEYDKARYDAVAAEGAGDWPTNNSDSGVGEDIEREMENQPYDVYETPEIAVPLINKLVDRVHIRGDIAGAFVEGGAPTCSAVSNMKPDELY